MKYQTITKGTFFATLLNNVVDIRYFKVNDIFHIVHFDEVALIFTCHQTPYESVDDVCLIICQHNL